MRRREKKKIAVVKKQYLNRTQDLSLAKELSEMKVMTNFDINSESLEEKKSTNIIR